jgi:Na+-transporting NADH:ubiquinone oxidoreductase subunit NqrF
MGCRKEMCLVMEPECLYEDVCDISFGVISTDFIVLFILEMELQFPPNLQIAVICQRVYGYIALTMPAYFKLWCKCRIGSLLQ